MEQAQLIKKLRTERGYTQKQLCEGISSRTTLSSFENRGTELSSGILLQYLDRMNLRVEEYQLLLENQEISPKRRLAAQFVKEYYAGHFTTELKSEIWQNYLTAHDFYYYILWFETETILTYKNNQFDPQKYQKEINKICDYLFKVEVWQHFEMTTFMNLMFAFSDDMILALFESSKETMAENATNPYYTSLTTSFFINGIILGFQRKNDQILTQFLTGLTTVAKKPKYMYAKMMALYFEKLLQARDASDPASIDFTDFYHALALFGMIEKAQELQEFYTEIVENN